MPTLHPPLRRRVFALTLLLAIAATACGKGARSANVQPSASVESSSIADEDELRSTTATRVEELLQGRFPGVRVFRHAGGGISVQIRGQTSITAVQQPLYVVDGMVIDDAGSGGLIGINPNEITRIEVLKDIGSTAFYGARGANGVVLITMRRRN